MPLLTDVLDYERGQACTIQPSSWQTDTSISTKSWGYIEGDTYKSTASVIANLVDIVSKNGNLLMNVGVRVDVKVGVRLHALYFVCSTRHGIAFSTNTALFW